MSAESRAMEESDERWFRGVDEDDYPPRDEEESETATPAAPSEEMRKLVDVQRFAFSMEDGIPGMDERPSGRWVRYEDYASLLSAISRIEAENARLTEGWRRKARELGEAVTQRDSLRAALSEARKDTERLDWLNGKVSWFTQHFAYDHKYATLREAIDDAAFRLGGTDRKEEKP